VRELLLVDRLTADLGLDAASVGVVVVDHGSRRAESNALLDDVAALFARVSGMPIVEPAHMELAEPSIAVALARCVERGATTVVVFPYFLSPGRHWTEDIPRLAAEAAAPFRDVRYVVTSPLGLHDLMAELMALRVEQCVRRSTQDGPPCDLCEPHGGCRMHGPHADAAG